MNSEICAGRQPVGPDPTPAAPGRSFVIIGGMPRSGTTLMRGLLNVHPDVALLPVEFKFVETVAWGDSVADLLASEKLRHAVEVPAGLSKASPGVVYREILLRQAERLNRPIAGEKSPLNEFWYDQILSWLPGDQVRFVHMVRNPFEVLGSFKHAQFRLRRGGPLGHSLRNVLTTNWVRSVSLGLARQLRDPVGYRLVRYEDLVSHPEAQVADLCRFLGLEGDPRTLLESTTEQLDTNTSFPADAQAAPRAAGALYRPEPRAHQLSASETRAAADVVGELATALGYDVPRPTRSGPVPYPWRRLGSLRWLKPHTRSRPSAGLARGPGSDGS